MHRLPQGHRPPPAGHVRRSRLELARRGALLAAGGLLARAARAQRGAVDPARFGAFAGSSAEFQRRAAAIASSRGTRPEVKDFATSMLRFREQQLARLGASAELQPEHRAVLENLEPLDHLALSRRYMEVALQSLDQEVRGYEAASQDGQGGTKALAEEGLPEIRRWREEARRVLAKVMP